MRAGISRGTWRQKKSGKGGDDNFTKEQIRNGQFYDATPNISIIDRAGLFAAGTALVVGTVAEDFFTGGAGIANDPATLSADGGLIIRAFMH